MRRGEGGGRRCRPVVVRLDLAGRPVLVLNFAVPARFFWRKGKTVPARSHASLFLALVFDVVGRAVVGLSLPAPRLDLAGRAVLRLRPRLMRPATAAVAPLLRSPPAALPAVKPQVVVERVVASPLNKVPCASSPHSGGGGAEGSRDFLIANPKRRARAAIGGRSLRSRRRRPRLWWEDGSFLNLHKTGRARLDFSPPPPSPLPAKAAIRKFKSRQGRSRPAPMLQMMLPTL
uniref:Uncharacterized protein n=1 Tax=Oryza glumipatula TaxID=40148 RepID=A0A0E0BBC3_9ORYZ